MKRIALAAIPLCAILLAAGGYAAASASAEGDAEPAESSAPAVDAPAPRTQFSIMGERTQGGWVRGLAPTGAVSARLGTQELVLEADGAFFAAFDRDAAGQEEFVATMADGSTIVTPVVIAPRNWNIEHVNVARSAGGASASFMERRRPELAQINAARTQDAPATGWEEDFIWPLTGRISGRFGSQRIYRGEPGSYHSGIDIATGGSGNPFVAPASGVVTLATDRPFSLEGYLLIIDHGHGLNSAFLHLSDIAVKEGDVVEQGQLLGHIGSSGRATGPHLHWSIKWRDARLDPLLFTGPMP